MNVNQKIWLGFGSVLALVGIGSTLGYLKSREAESASARLVSVNLAEYSAAKSADEEISMARIYEQKFAASRNEQWIPKLKGHADALKQEMANLQKVSSDPAHRAAAAEVVAATDAYLEKFSTYHQLMVRRGLTPESGLEGQLRAAVHEVESKVKDQGLAELTVLLLMVRRHEKDYLLRGDVKYLQEINARIAEFAEQMKQFSLPAELQKDIAAKWAGYAAAMKSLVETDQEARRVSEELVKGGELVEEKVGTLTESCSKAINTTQASTLATLAGGRRTTLVIGISSGVIGAAMAVWIAFGLGSLNRGIRRAAEAIDQGSGEIHHASSQLTHSSQSLAQGSSEQAASLEETSASLEELSSMTKRNADSATRAKELSAQTRAAAETGAAKMEQMNQAMAEITSSSHDISKIIKTIDEIAFQTNILALNAAVEAARAGEAGAGFAVVADEVRNLAQRAAKSARETAEKIEGSVAKSEHGATISRQVAESLTEIRQKAREVDTFVAEIAQASNEQSQGIGQVNTAVSQMDQVTQSNASAAEESASAAEELNAQTTVLRTAASELLALVGGPAETKPKAPAAERAEPAPHKVNGHKPSFQKQPVTDFAPPTVKAAPVPVDMFT